VGRLVAKLKAARDAKKAMTGKCGGRKTYAERDAAMVALAKEIKGRSAHVSLRDVAAELAERGYTTPSGKPYSASRRFPPTLCLARIMHHVPRFCMPGPHAYCTRTPSIRPVWIGVRQLAVQRVWV
jgi:hypothetical protein